MDAKAWYQSKTIIGALVAVLAALLGVAGVDVNQPVVVEVVLKLVEVGGSLVAIYGRVKADKPISMRKA